jgi:brefeldin A-resistance guanine nucleotide exchange factor 1
LESGHTANTFFRSLGDTPLVDVMDAILIGLPSFIDRTPAAKQLYYPATLFYLELAVLLTIAKQQNPGLVSGKLLDRLTFYITRWDILDSKFLNRIMAYALIIVRNGDDSFVENMNSVFAEILRINPSVLAPAVPTIVGPLTCLGENDAWSRDKVLATESFWSLVNLAASNQASSRQIFVFVEGIIKNSPREINGTNFCYFLDVLGRIANVTHQELKKPSKKQESDDDQGSSDALNTLCTMDQFIEQIWQNDGYKQGWEVMWYQYIQALANQCVNSSRQTRSQALTYYQRILLSQELHSRKGFDWIATFDKAIFPLIGSLLKPEIYEIDPEGMASTRLQAASLLCKVFLQYVVQIQQHSNDVLVLWIKILDTLDRLINSGQRDSLRESVVESLKNVILVVSSSEFGADDEFWTETWKRIDAFLPGLRQELAPPQDVVASDPEPADQIDADEKKDNLLNSNDL